MESEKFGFTKEDTYIVRHMRGSMDDISVSETHALPVLTSARKCLVAVVNSNSNDDHQTLVFHIGLSNLRYLSWHSLNDPSKPK